MKRTALKRGDSELKRKTPLRPVSRKRQRETQERAEVREETLASAGYRCSAVAVVPEVTCWGPLDVDERKARGVNPGGHLDRTNTQVLCRAHHDWRHANPTEARNRGLRKASYD